MRKGATNPQGPAGTLAGQSRDGFSIRRDENDKGILFHHRRELEDGQFLFLVNTSIDAASSGRIMPPANLRPRYASRELMLASTRSSYFSTKNVPAPFPYRSTASSSRPRTSRTPPF